MRNIVEVSFVSARNILKNELMFRHKQLCTVAETQRVLKNETWSMLNEGLKLLLARALGALGAKGYGVFLGLIVLHP